MISCYLNAPQEHCTRLFSLVHVKLVGLQCCCAVYSNEQSVVFMVKCRSRTDPTILMYVKCCHKSQGFCNCSFEKRKSVFSEKLYLSVNHLTLNYCVLHF